MTQELHGVISLGGTVIGGSLNQRGLKGETGDKGDKGDAATVTVGSTTTGAAGTSASVTNSGTQYAAVLDFTIPKGDKGDTGATGDVNTYIAEYGSATYAEIGSALSDGKYVIAQYNNDYYPLIMFSNSSYVFSYIHENICHEVVCDSYSAWTARTHTSVRDVKQNGASVTTSGVALVTTPQPTTTTPKMDGTAAVGSETTWAKGDHVHPSDTSKSDVGHTHTKSDITDFSHTHTKSEITDFPTLATVATSGDYDDLIDKPAIHNVPSGGTSGQVLTKDSSTDYDASWADPEVTRAELESVLPTDTASGAIASFPDGSDLFDYLSCIVNIEPVQAGSGTPSPDNVRPITGWTGCEVDVAGTDYTKEGQTNGYRLDGSGGVVSSAAYVVTDYIDVHDKEKVFVGSTWDSSAWTLRVARYDASKTFIDETDTTKLSATDASIDVGNEYYIRVSVPYLNVSCYVYTGTTYPVSWQTEAGTVYGGTVDLVSGGLVVDRAMVDLGSLNWSYYSPNAIFYSSGIQDTAAYVSMTAVANAVCSEYETVMANGYNEGKDSSISIGGAIVSKGVNVKDSRYTDAAAFKTGMSGVQLCYELATPTTYQLTPTQIHALLGTNNVWADCGDVEVQYKADVQRWVEKQLKEINTAILALS